MPLDSDDDGGGLNKYSDDDGPEPLTQLHDEICEFAERVAPKPSEIQAKNNVLRTIQTSCANALGAAARAEAFGSHATGTSLHSSDIDVVVLNLVEPVEGGFTPMQKMDVNSYLNRLCRELYRIGLLKKVLHIRHARIPILKCTLHCGTAVDISIGGTSGPHAVRTMRSFLERYPPARKLVLVLKSLLKHHGLNEVCTGGLGSYSLTCMVIAHLQEEEWRNGQQAAGGARKGGGAGGGALKGSCYGRLLVSFLRRFGTEFDYDAQAVAIAHGGIVPRQDRDTRPELRINVIDPNSGRDVSGGSHQMFRVMEAFRDAYVKLSAALRNHAPEHGQYLRTVLNTGAALSRSRQTYNAVAPPRQQQQLPQPLLVESSPGVKRKRDAAAGRDVSGDAARRRQGGGYGGGGGGEAYAPSKQPHRSPGDDGMVRRQAQPLPPPPGTAPPHWAPRQQTYPAPASATAVGYYMPYMAHASNGGSLVPSAQAPGMLSSVAMQLPVGYGALPTPFGNNPSARSGNPQPGVAYWPGQPQPPPPQGSMPNNPYRGW